MQVQSDATYDLGEEGEKYEKHINATRSWRQRVLTELREGTISKPNTERNSLILRKSMSQEPSVTEDSVSVFTKKDSSLTSKLSRSFKKVQQSYSS